MTLRTLNYGNYGIFLIMGNAGFCPSAVVPCPCCFLPEQLAGTFESDRKRLLSVQISVSKTLGTELQRHEVY